MSPDLEEWVRAWIDKADHDLMAADRLLNIAPPLLDIACFHCQQAAEKFLKAFLSAHEVYFERTHNIKNLLLQCGVIDSDFSAIDPGKIDLYAVDARYPDKDINPTKAEAFEYFKMSNVIREKVIKKMGLDIGLRLQKKNPIEPKLLVKQNKIGNGLLEKKVKPIKIPRKKS